MCKMNDLSPSKSFTLESIIVKIVYTQSKSIPLVGFDVIILLVKSRVRGPDSRAAAAISNATKT